MPARKQTGSMVVQTVFGQVQTIEVEEVRYGKAVRSRGGPLHDKALYGINFATPGIIDPLRFIPANFIDNASFAASMIDPEFAECGALVVKAVPEGLAFMRLRYRAEAGEGEGGRQFLLSRTIILPGATHWHDVPSGLFAWCEKELTVDPLVYGEAAPASGTQITLHLMPARDLDWLDTLSQRRKVQLGSIFQAVTRRNNLTVSGMFAEEEQEKPSALIAQDLDVIAALPRKFPLRESAPEQFIFNLGLDPALTPGAISYFPGQRGSAIEAPDLRALRDAIADEERAPLEQSPEEQDIQFPDHVEKFCDNLDRRIGREPIPLRLKN